MDCDRWMAGYLPGAIARGPFAIGFQYQVVDGALQATPVVHVDMDHPRVVHDDGGEGMAVFLPKPMRWHWRLACRWMNASRQR